MSGVNSCTALETLKLDHCKNITTEAVLALSCLPALTRLDLGGSGEVTAAGVQALRSTTASTNLHIDS